MTSSSHTCCFVSPAHCLCPFSPCGPHDLEPGQGPSKKERDNGFFWVDFFAKAKVNGKEITTRGRVGSDKGDPGYKATAKVSVCGDPVTSELTLLLCLDLEMMALSKHHVAVGWYPEQVEEIPLNRARLWSNMRIPSLSRYSLLKFPCFPQMLAEGALCLVLDEDMSTRNTGGVLTTASALGMPFIDRMRKAGMTFDVMDM